MRSTEGTVMVLARGALADDRAALALRVALALPLGCPSVVLALVGPAAALAVPGAAPGGRATQVARELAALVDDEEVPVLVEQESLVAMGLQDSGLHPGVSQIARREIHRACLEARSCIVI
jgi:thiamine monophosphate synthase